MKLKSNFSGREKSKPKSNNHNKGKWSTEMLKE